MPVNVHHYVHFQTPQGPDSPYPAHEGNTGYQNAAGYPGSPGALTDGSGLTPVNGQSYSHYNFPSGLELISKSNITFTGCRFASNDSSGPNVHLSAVSGITFSYCTFEPSTVSAGSEPAISDTSYQIAHGSGYQYGIRNDASGVFTADHCRFWGYANAISFGPTNGTQVTNSLFQNPRADGGVDHTDGPGELDQSTLSNLTISGCTIIGIGNTNGIALQGGTYDGLTITGNYLSGYGYMCFLGTTGVSGQTTVNELFSGNTWGTDIEPGSGPVYGSYIPFGVSHAMNNNWVNNKIRVVAGTSWMAAGNDGLYWWPSDGNPPNGSAIIGHAADYTNP